MCATEVFLDRTLNLLSVVCVDELIVVDAVCGVAFYALNSGFAAVEGDDVVDEGLALGGEGEGFRGVRGVVFGAVGLAHFVLFAGCGGHDCGCGGRFIGEVDVD